MALVGAFSVIVKLPRLIVHSTTWGGGGPGGAVTVAVGVAGRGEGVRHGVVVGVEALDPV